jgi:hypothetical protein
MEFNLMVDYIVQEVLKRLENESIAKRKKGLVILNGGTANLEQIVIELEKIKKEYDVEIIFSEAGEKIVGEEKFKNFDIKREVTMANCNSLISENEIILLPLLTKNTCAKVAVGIRDNVVTYIISKALLAGKKIVAVYDSCIVKADNEYGKQLNLNIKRLQEFGITFVESKNLAEYVLKEQKNQILDLKNKKIITADDIFGIKNKSVIVSKEAIITILAKEKAQENGIIFELEK